jgi:hypothetical protein
LLGAFRYYISPAVLQSKPHAMGSVIRIPAAELEALVLTALRSHLNPSDVGQNLPDSDRDLVERHVERVTLAQNEIKVRLREIGQDPLEDHDPQHSARRSSGSPSSGVRTIVIPWTSPVPARVKGIMHVPAHNTPVKPDRREALLITIAKARSWINDLMQGGAASFAAIARREGQVERHIRKLAPLAFLSPRIVSAILDGNAPADLTVTKLARALPSSWAEQERQVGIPALFLSRG